MATIANFGDEKLASEALARIKPQLAALSPEQLLQVNLDVQTAAATVLGALPEIRVPRAHFEGAAGVRRGGVR